MMIPMASSLGKVWIPPEMANTIYTEVTRTEEATQQEPQPRLQEHVEELRDIEEIHTTPPGDMFAFPEWHDDISCSSLDYHFQNNYF